MLKNIYKQYLLQDGVKEEQIIVIELDLAKDIKYRKKIVHQDVLEQILDLLCSSIGSLTNPTKIADTLRSKQTVGVAANTIRSYIGHLEDAFLFAESKRYDVKGKSYFDSPNKYYSEDIGLRNARIGFRQHIRCRLDLLH